MIYLLTSELVYLLTFDLMISESHDWSSEVTQHVVESGLVVTDHVRKKPKAVSFELFLSNEPVYHADMRTRAVELTQAKNLKYPGATLLPGQLVGEAQRALSRLTKGPANYTATVGVFDTPIDPIGLTLDALERIRDDQQLLDIYTPKRAYSNMVLESVRMSRGKEDGTGARLALNFHEVRVVETKLTAAPRAPTQQKKQVQKGVQAPKPAEVKASALSQASGRGTVAPSVIVP